MISVTRIECPTCGAPLRVDDGQRVVLCTYCNGSLRVTDATGGTCTLSRDENIPPALVESVKAEVLAGRRDAAVLRYARETGVTPADAAVAVNHLVGLAVIGRMPYAPMRPHGFAMLAAFVAAPGALAGVAAGALREAFSVGALLAAVACGLLCLYALRSLGRHTFGTWVFRYGAPGRALVRKAAVLQTIQGGSNVQLLFEVTPEGGGASFIHEEVCSLADTSRAKLVPGNVVRVRIGLGGRLVFPASPIEVLSSGAGRG